MRLVLETLVGLRCSQVRLGKLQPSLPEHSLIYTANVCVCVFDVCLCVLTQSPRFDSESPYQMLASFHRQIQEREAVMASLVESASLFEVTVSEYKQLRQCR